MTRAPSRPRLFGLVGAAAVLALALSACGGGNISNNNTSSSGKTCGTVNIALNNWVGYTADAYVVGDLATKKLGCTVKYENLAETPSWAGMANGTIDTILENWGHEDLVKKYITQQHVVEDAGMTGNQGIIGWYVPPWMAAKYPDITDWKNLNKYSSMFKTSESGGKGQLLDGDPSYVTNDQALVKNLNLNYQVVVGGSEAALIESFKSAEANKTPLLAYFYEPQWFFSEMKLVKVNLPKYTPGCDAVAAKVACDYPPYHLNKLISTKFAKSGSPAVTLIKNFHWTNADQNLVATYIAKDGMKPADAAQKWIDANQDLVNQWLQGT
ncbi:MAG TPA: ABC transporter substrate-binding protein [Nocardioides sp.]|nr:ABC transporter substrate-binding protein [Nocardioides sp.]